MGEFGTFAPELAQTCGYIVSHGLTCSVLGNKKKRPSFWPLRGAGRSRTAVQTVNRCAFYMLIRWLVVGAAPDIGTQGHPYPLLFHLRLEKSRGLSRLSVHLLVSSRRSGRLGDVPFPCLARELSRTYCSSVRQRERSCFRQLLFCVCFQGLWRVGLHAYKPIILAVKTKQPQY